MRKLAVLLFFVASLNAETLLTDDFTSTSLNTAKWRTIGSGSIASVVQASGGVTITAGAVMGTAAQFTPPYSISGVVTMLDLYEHFEVCFRSSSGGTVGMFVSFSNDGDQISIQQANPVGVAPVPILKVDSYPLATNKPYSFEIRDTGETITLLINGVEKISAQSTFSGGGYIAFRSRNFSQTASRLSGVTIGTLPPPVMTVNVPYAVPDTSSHLVNMSTLASGTFTTGFVISGDTPKKMLIRGVGPALRMFGVPNAASDTRLTLNSSSSVVAVNAGWSTAINAAQISAFAGAFPLQANSADSAILVTLNPGSYTATVASNGTVLLEAYEVP